MSISFSCPHCQSRMTVPDTLAGKRGKCSRCKGIVMVPAVDANGAAAGAGGPPPVPPHPTAHDLEAAAAAALADEPQEEVKAVEFVEFTCPQCDEPIKLSLEHAGKKHPCPNPECRRIISVPFPKDHKKKDWRDTGPKLPTAARRPDEPAPEGAWGSHTRTGASTDALKQAGVLKEKEKPLTLYQRVQPYLVIGTLVLVLLIGGLGLWNLWAAARERRALEDALAYADSEPARKEVRSAGLAALQAGAGDYYLRSNRSGSVEKARDHLNQAVTLAQESRDPARDALLTEVAVLLLDLGGSAAQVQSGARLKWDDVHKRIWSSLAAISDKEARLEALRLVSAGLIERGEAARALSLAAQAYATPGADQSEALATAGLELLRRGKRDEATGAAEQAEAAFANEKERTSLRPAVVALSVALGRKPPTPAKGGVEDDENFAIGQAEGLATQGKLDDARKAVDKVRSHDSRVRAFVALAGAADKTDSADVNTALEYLAGPGRDRSTPVVAWPLLRLVRIGLRAGVPADQLEPAVAAIQEPSLAAWGRLLLFRARLAGARATESADALQSIPSGSLASLVARTDLARHNTRRDGGWANTIKTWEDGPRAFASLGVALGMQKER